MTGVACLLNGIADVGDFQIEGDILLYLQETNNGLLVFDSDMTTLEKVERDHLYQVGSAEANYVAQAIDRKESD